MEVDYCHRLFLIIESAVSGNFVVTLSFITVLPLTHYSLLEEASYHHFKVLSDATGVRKISETAILGIYTYLAWSQ